MSTGVSRRRVLRTLGVGALGTTVVGSVPASGGPKPGSESPETLFTYDPDAGELPENVAIDPRGNKYVSFPPLGEVRKITPDNSAESLLTTFDTNDGDFGVIGLEVTPTGVVYACLVTTPGADQLGVWRIERDGSRSLYAGLPGGSFPNDVLPDGDRLLVTDTTAGAVWEVREGNATRWVVDPLLAGTGAAGFGIPLGANGIVRKKDGSVVVANTEKGHLVRIPVSPDGSAGTPELFVAARELAFSDGLAVDTRDNVYVAVIGQSTVVRVAPDGSIETLATADDGLDNSSDVTFGTSRGEQKDLFITNYALLSLEAPSLMKLDVGVPGAPIHR